MLDAKALLDLLKLLDANDYDFVTPTPATHRQLLARRPVARPHSLRDVLGWGLPFETVDPKVADLLTAAGALEPAPDGRRRAAIRISRVHGRLFVHSAFPTEEDDSVFLGPDSYRFADFIRREVAEEDRHVVDIGAGAGVGAIVVAPAARLVLTDVNPRALAFAEINAAHAGVRAEFIQTRGLAGLDGPIDLVLANPPYMIDEKGREYRDGGGGLGANLSIEWARQAVDRLESGGRMLLYSGSAIVDGHDALKTALEALPGASVRYREIDPDVFGGELAKPAYAAVERIAAIGAIITKL